MEAQVCPVPQVLTELVDYARLQAVKDAERVSLYLEQQGVPKDRPLLLEHARLLATALRFREWEATDIDLHVKNALPAADNLLAFGEHELGTLAPALIVKVRTAMEKHGSDLGGLKRSLKKIGKKHYDQVVKALLTLRTTFRDLPDKAMALTLEHFAWSAPALLGVEVLIEQPESGGLDDVVDLLAGFFIQHRDLLTGTSVN